MAAPDTSITDAGPRWGARFPLTVGVIALALLVGGLGVWSMRTNLSGAVVTTGIVQVETRRQVIEHPEGGVVSQILAHDGDLVGPGDVLIRLDGTRLRSELAIITAQMGEIAARQARLAAEATSTEEITFEPALLSLAANDAQVRSQLDGETALFVARRTTMQQQTSLLAEQNAQIENRITGTEAQLGALKIQRGIIEEELTDQQSLLDQGLTHIGKVRALQREQAALLGQVGSLTAEIAELRGQSASNDISVLQLQTERQEEAVRTQRDLQFSLIELSERQIALTDTLSRLDVRAPTGGIVYNTQVTARQSVVRPAEPIMYLVPQDEPLVVSVRVNSTDIDEVSIGQDVSLRFSAFDQRNQPPVPGRVAKISADTIVDDATGQTYYATEIAPNSDVAVSTGGNVLLPGMPVEAFIKTGDRTAIAYLTEPLAMFFSRSFRE